MIVIYRVFVFPSPTQSWKRIYSVAHRMSHRVPCLILILGSALGLKSWCQMDGAAICAKMSILIRSLKAYPH
jgi:hypothetical protein